MFIEHTPFNRWSGQYDSFSLAIDSEFAMFGLLNPGVQGAQDAAYRRVCGEPAMSPHRLFRSPTAGAALLRSARPLPRLGRRRFGLCVARLEDRILLSADDGFGHDLAHATDIDLTEAEFGNLTGTLDPTDAGAGPSADVFRISPTEDGRLYATVHPQVTATRLSLLDDQGRLLIQSDGLSPTNPATT